MAEDLQAYGDQEHPGQHAIKTSTIQVRPLRTANMENSYQILLASTLKMWTAHEQELLYIVFTLSNFIISN